MSMNAPLRLRYEGEGRFRALTNRADEDFVVGEVYPMVEERDRSTNSHNHFFATVTQAWKTLPEELSEQYPTADHLRKKALVWKGWRDERTIACASKAEAERVAAFVKPMDDFAVVTRVDAVVRVWTAKSQSKKAMGAADFQQSKQDVLDFIDDLLGVERGSTARSEAA
jgi:hypothetical protein